MKAEDASASTDGQEEETATKIDESASIDDIEG